MHNDANNDGYNDRFNFVLDEADKLLPCPFCGSAWLALNNTHTASYWIECQDCDAQVHGAYFELIQIKEAHEQAAASAIEKWNTRVTGSGGEPEPDDDKGEDTE